MDFTVMEDYIPSARMFTYSSVTVYTLLTVSTLLVLVVSIRFIARRKNTGKGLKA